MPSEGDILRRLIKSSNKKQGEIAKEIGYTSEHISKAYKKEVLAIGLKQKIIEYFNLPSDYFTQGDKSKSELQSQIERIEELMEQLEHYKKLYEEESERNKEEREKNKQMLDIIDRLTAKIQAIKEE